jgi:hypothetical protein
LPHRLQKAAAQVEVFQEAVDSLVVEAEVEVEAPGSFLPLSFIIHFIKSCDKILF